MIYRDSKVYQIFFTADDSVFITSLELQNPRLNYNILKMKRREFQEAFKQNNRTWKITAFISLSRVESPLCRNEKRFFEENQMASVSEICLLGVC